MMMIILMYNLFTLWKSIANFTQKGNLRLREGKIPAKTTQVENDREVMYWHFFKLALPSVEAVCTFTVE